MEIVNQGEYASGGAFRLGEAPEGSHAVAFDDWEVEIQEENPFVVVRTSRTIPQQDLVDVLYEHLQRGLDMFSIQNDTDHRCQKLHSERIIGWCEDGSQCLRTVGISDLNMSTSVSVTLLDADGEVKETEPPETEWHESLRFFRLSQSTDDLFDSYRNAFLALETLLSDRVPKNPDEGESDWLKRALKDAQDDIELGNFAPNSSAAVKSFHGYQYESTRCEMFHSKISEPDLVPHRIEDRRYVQDALKELSRMYVSLLKETIEINRQGGVMTNNGFEYMTRSLLDKNGARIALSSNNTPFDSSENLDSAAWRNSAQREGFLSEEHSRPGETCVLAEWPISEADHPVPIHRIGLVNVEEDGDGLVSSTRVESGLTLGGIDIFETLLGLRLNNADSVKTRFPG